ncbi:MAG: glycosyltransferase family 39 protein [Lachnospiraceae bacterium]|nr:glycosyltransferase family 39 protein [Lachnospiraceae bacterium]
MLILWGIYGYGIERIYGFSVFQDEFGYWANAASIAGYDWSGCAGLYSYYSYGYSLLLAVVLKLFQDSMTAYRAAIALNVILLCITTIMIWKIVDSLFTEAGEGKKIFSLGVAVFYPVTTFYMQMTLTESLLTFLYVLICYLVLCFCESEKVSTAVSLAVILVYIFVVHMRAAGVVGACVLVLGWRGYRQRSGRKALLIGAVVFVLCMILGMHFKGFFEDTVYGSTSQEMLVLNDVTGQVGKIKTFFSVDGIYNFLHSVLGKLFYLGMATWGTLYFAITYCIRHCRKTIMQFILLSATAQFLVSALYMSSPGRIDTVVYGRYNDYLMPLLIVIGILEMISGRYLYRKTAAVIVGNGIAMGVLIRYMRQEDLYLLKGYFAAGMGYVWKARKSWDTDIDVAWEMGKAYLVCAVLIVLLVLCVEIIRHIRNTEWVLCGFICVEIILSMVLSSKYTFLFNDINYGCLRVVDYLQENDKKQVLYIDEGGFPYIDLVQFYMRDLSIDIWKADAETDWEQLLDENACLLVNEDCSYLEELEMMKEPCIQSGSLIVFDWEHEK